jgi:hypothetical protein
MPIEAKFYLTAFVVALFCGYIQLRVLRRFEAKLRRLP